nr:hypothetical protein [Coxiella-like endosymbiont]
MSKRNLRQIRYRDIENEIHASEACKASHVVHSEEAFHLFAQKAVLQQKRK